MVSTIQWKSSKDDAKILTLFYWMTGILSRIKCCYTINDNV